MHRRSVITQQTLLSIGLIGLFLSLVLAAGCTSQPASAGALPAQSPAIGTGAIITDPASYQGKEIVIKGRITTECGSGCWFILNDGTGSLYVDLAGNNFAIPQMQGSTVAVKGIIGVENGDPRLYASNVTTGSRSWP